MIYREAGQYKTTYQSDQAIFPIAQDRFVVLAVLAIAYFVVPLMASEYVYRAVLIPTVILGLAAWSNALEQLATALGIINPPNALFFVSLGFIVVLLLHFSAAVSRLSDQSKVLAQRLALMEQRMRQLEDDPLHDPHDRQLLETPRTGRFVQSGTRDRD